jgi:hypothetical protein
MRVVRSWRAIQVTELVGESDFTGLTKSCGDAKPTAEGGKMSLDNDGLYSILITG